MPGKVIWNDGKQIYVDKEWQIDYGLVKKNRFVSLHWQQPG
jgi:hypothetical protein